MTREEIKKMLPILQAFADGKTIESRCIKGDKSLWYDDDDPSFDNDLEYRIKPEPRYRPFKDSEECWNEMQKHQPFGWIKDRDGDKTFIGSINSDNSIFTCSSEILFLKEIFEDFTFIDGIPFGIKENKYE